MPPKQKLDGLTLVHVLKNLKSKWFRPSLTTFGTNYSSVSSERYIIYPNGSEELYDYQSNRLPNANTTN